MKESGIENVEFSEDGSKLEYRRLKSLNLVSWHERAVVDWVSSRRERCFQKLLDGLEISDEVLDKFQPRQAGAKVLAGAETR